MPTREYSAPKVSDSDGVGDWPYLPVKTPTDLKKSLSGALPEVHGNTFQSHMVMVMSSAQCGQMVCPCIERLDAHGDSKNSGIFPPMELTWASGIIMIVASL